jgi:ABC-type polysaccharide/polyol phosphate export permease
MKRASILAELWQFRGLLRSLVIRDLKVKYQRSLLGLTWTLLNPLLTVAILVTVFTYIVRIQIVNYWAFLISGFFVWNFIQRTLSHSTTILKEHASLSRSVYYPSEVLILSASLSKLVEFLIEIAIVLLVLILFHHRAVPASLVLLPLLIALQVILSIGLMFPLAAIAVLYYDVQHAMPIVIFSLFYISPVFYPVEMIPVEAQPYYYLNPFVGLLRLFHVVLYEGGWPSVSLLTAVSVVAILICVVGHGIFKRRKEFCVEVA